MNVLSLLAGVFIALVLAGGFLAVRRLGLATRYWRTIALVVGVVAQTVVILIVVAYMTQNRTSVQQAKAQAEVARKYARDKTADAAKTARDRAQAQADTLEAVCLQGANIRRELNRRVRAHSIDRAVLLAALKLAGTRGPLHKSFAHLRQIEQEKVNFVALPIPECGPPSK